MAQAMSDQAERLIQWLRSAEVTHFHFVNEGRQQVCVPKYLLVQDRDFIIGLLERSTALSGGQ